MCTITLGTSAILSRSQAQESAHSSTICSDELPFAKTHASGFSTSEHLQHPTPLQPLSTLGGCQAWINMPVAHTWCRRASGRVGVIWRLQREESEQKSPAVYLTAGQPLPSRADEDSGLLANQPASASFQLELQVTGPVPGSTPTSEPGSLGLTFQTRQEPSLVQTLSHRSLTHSHR